jgi:type IV secretory pathway VirB10-like protein
VTGRYLLVPQGSRLVGKYDHLVAFGQERALVVWQRIILPDGASIVIDNLPATDTGGYAGLADQVDLHTWKLLKGVALATVLGVGSELAFRASDSDLVKALQQSTQSTTNRAGHAWWSAISTSSRPSRCAPAGHCASSSTRTS